MARKAEQRRVAGARHRVVHVRAGQRLALAVEHGALHQRLADALNHAAVGLTLDQQRIDQGAEVVDHVVAHDLDDAGVGIDLDLRDVAAVGERRRRRLVDVPSPAP